MTFFTETQPTAAQDAQEGVQRAQSSAPHVQPAPMPEPHVQTTPTPSAQQTSTPRAQPTPAPRAQPSTKMHISHLNVFYGATQALQNITLDIYNHSVLALIGPSGCGKSTFLRCLNRMNDTLSQARISGDVLLDGKDIYAPNSNVIRLRKRVGMVFQQPNPFPMSIYDNVAYGPRVHGITKKSSLDEIVTRSLQRAAIYNEVKDHLNDSALSLSGGQQQRLCIARALAVEPEVLLMDEPTSALDPISTAKIEELIVSLKEHYTVVIVTHNMQQAARVSDYTAFFLLGEMVETHSTYQLFHEPHDERCADYVMGRFG